MAFLLTGELKGQRKSDIGFMAAVPWYQGDISTLVPRPTVVPPAVGPIFRYNFNQRNSLRAHGVFYSLGYEGEVFNGVPASFQASFVDLGLDFEFNWWNYKTAWRKTKYSPYVSVGVGYSLNYNGGSVNHAYIPFGGGLKANLGKRMSGGLELSVRKTFTDMIDSQTNIDGSEINVVGNNDWYFFTGVFVTYKIFEYRDACPAMGEGASKEKIRKGSVRLGKSKNKKIT
jgi:hypothetical protein